MAIGDISLTAGMRKNLLDLQGTSKLMDRTQTRLSTGKKVNTAIDNPTNFFAAKGHLDRASDLTSRKDAMGEAIQTVKSADNGISAMTALIESAKGIIQSARSASDPETINTLAAQYNEVLDQMDNVVSDSGYKGINLLGGSDVTLTVTFNEDGSSVLGLNGVDADYAVGLGVSGASTGTAGTPAVYEAVGGGTTLTPTNTEVTAATAATAGWTDLDASATQLDGALETLRGNSETLAANLSIITIRQDFTDNMIGTLQEGADNLTLADQNEEGANMLMLQTRQQLGITALSLSSQASQAVLGLF